MNATDKAIESFQSRLDYLNHIHTAEKFNEWKVRTLATLAHVFGEEHSHYKALDNITTFQYNDITKQAIGKAKELLTGLIDNLRNFGFPKNVEIQNKGVVVSVNQSNQQSQSTQVSVNFELIIESLKYGLSGSQIEELKEILQSNQEPKAMKKTFVE